jgi:hypothetical protein
METKRGRARHEKKARSVQGVEMIPVFCFAQRLISTYKVGWCDDSGGGGGWVDIPFTPPLSLLSYPPYPIPTIPITPHHVFIAFFTVRRQARHRAQTQSDIPWNWAGLGRAGLDWIGLDWVVFYVYCFCLFSPLPLAHVSTTPTTTTLPYYLPSLYRYSLFTTSSPLSSNSAANQKKRDGGTDI